MKKIELAIVLSLSVALLGCGGSGSKSHVNKDHSGNDSIADTTKEELIEGISGESWMKECFLVRDYLTMTGENYITVTININSSLEATTTTHVYLPGYTSCNHHSFVESLSFTTQLEIKDKSISDESIEAYALNISFKESPDITDIPTSYSLIYLDSEKLYFGKDSGENLGESTETRHSSISLDDYYQML